ncbi:MAG: hypothetical protein COC24_003560 [Alphaproteobacteria bacterium]|nr:hypothetical protein [Alphaproteobacteria bacterium]
MTAKQILTRFRAYQLGQAGSSFSYFANGKFTLIEARITDTSRENLNAEIKHCGKQRIDNLHITSWDQDHCAVADLEEILATYKPKKVEYPGYNPESDCGKKCREMILQYKHQCFQQGDPVHCSSISPEYIKKLNDATKLGYKNILYWPKEFSTENANDNSVVKFFRDGSFNVLSLGDVENITGIGGWSFKHEVDILILAHHGANCATNSKKFLKKISPRIAICSSNYGNQYDHPRQEVRNRLDELDVPIYTAKTGDIVVESVHPHDRAFKVTNLKANSAEISSEKVFKIKKHYFLSMNLDTRKNLYSGVPLYRRKR